MNFAPKILTLRKSLQSMSYCALDVNLCVYVNKRPKRPSVVRTKVQNNQDFIVQHSYKLQSHSKEKIQGISLNILLTY